MQAWLIALATTLSLTFGASLAEAGTRVALVVGNGAYEHTLPLTNPLNDAADVAAALRELGFEVIEGSDLDQAGFSRKVREFARAARGAEAAVFYYAGHGMQVEGRNYLLPVDARLSDEADLPFEALELSVVTQLMERASDTNLVFLDACRDNPLAQGLARSLGATRSTAVGRGLAPLDSGVGTLIAYATQPGNVAADGTGRNSPFTAAMLEHLATSGLEVNQFLNRVRRSVVLATDGQQVPWTHSALTGDFFLRPSETEEPAQTAAVSEDTEPSETPSAFDERQLDLAFWEAIAESGSIAAYEAYLEAYPDGVFVAVARLKIEELQQETQSNAGAPQQPPEAAAEEEAGEPEVETAALPAEESGASDAPALGEAALSLSRADRRSIQRALNDLGHQAGVVDGLFGPRTRAAIEDWQVAGGTPATGYLSADQAAALLEHGESVPPPNESGDSLASASASTSESEDADGSGAPLETWDDTCSNLSGVSSALGYMGYTHDWDLGDKDPMDLSGDELCNIIESQYLDVQDLLDSYSRSHSLDYYDARTPEAKAFVEQQHYHFMVDKIGLAQSKAGPFQNYHGVYRMSCYDLGYGGLLGHASIMYSFEKSYETVIYFDQHSMYMLFGSVRDFERLPILSTRSDSLVDDGVVKNGTHFVLRTKGGEELDVFLADGMMRLGGLPLKKCPLVVR